MKKSNIILSLVCNILIVLMEAFAFSNTIAGYVPGTKTMGWVDLADHFTTVSNAVLGIAALVMVIAALVALKKGHLSKFAVIFKLVAAVGTFITFIVAWAILLPSERDFNFVDDVRGFLWFHTVAPLLAIISLSFEKEHHVHWAWSFLGLGYVLAYGAPVLILCLKGTLPAIYPFLEKTNSFFLPCVIGIPVAGFALTLLFIVLHNVEVKKSVEPASASEAKTEPVAEQKEATPVAEKPVEEKKPEPEKPTEKQEEKPAPKKEDKVEEKKEEKPAEQKPVVVVIKQEVAQPAPAAAPVEKKAPIIAAKGKARRRASFETKVKNADEDLRHKYYELRDYIKSYGIHNRVSIPGDTFSAHRQRYIFVTISGKHLKVSYDLNPNSYKDSTIPVEFNKAKKFADLALLFKVRSDLSLKRAEQLVDDIMASKGVKKPEPKKPADDKAAK